MENDVLAGELYSLSKEITRYLITKTEKIRRDHNIRADELAKKYSKETDSADNVKIRYNIEEINELLGIVGEIGKKVCEHDFVPISKTNNTVTDASYTSKNDNRCQILINFIGTESNGYIPRVKITGPYKVKKDVINEFYLKLSDVSSMLNN